MTEKSVIEALEYALKYADSDVVEINCETIEGVLRLIKEKDEVNKMFQAELRERPNPYEALNKAYSEMLNASVAYFTDCMRAVLEQYNYLHKEACFINADLYEESVEGRNAEILAQEKLLCDIEKDFREIIKRNGG